MRERPTPHNLNEIYLGYEKDGEGFLRTIFELSSRNINGVELFIVTFGYVEKYQLRPEPVLGADECFLLRVCLGQVNPYTRDLKRIQRKMAYEMGYVPAQFYKFMDPNTYDYNFVTVYGTSFTARCRFGSKYCVRPSHLIPCLWNGEPLREVHPYKIPVVEKAIFPPYPADPGFFR